MLVYLLVACDRLDEKQEKKLKRNLPDLQAALQAYVDENEAGNVTLINDCESDDCEVGSIENGERDPVSYFGKQEGQGDAFLIGEYLGL